MAGWRCVRCKSDVDEGFDVCWSCGASREGEGDPAFHTVAEAPDAGDAASIAIVPDAPPSSDEKPAAPTRLCQACLEDMRPIQLIDRGQPNLWRGETADMPLRYAAADAMAAFWSGRIRPEGTVQAFACPRCGRIDLFALPHEGAPDR